MSEADAFGRVADQLCDVRCAIDDVDLNVLVDDDIRALLDAKAEVQQMTLDCRQNQHALQDGGDR